MTDTPRTLQDLEGMIRSGREESGILDYKDPRSLGKDDTKRTEISKDISAMANSAGGMVIYGIVEGKTPGTKHLPQAIVPVNRAEFSREWLENVIISKVQPRIEGLHIEAVPVSSNPDDVVYVVEIPPSTTAHQASDKKYYKRFNFQSVPMDDYEVRDVMHRLSHPKIEANFYWSRWETPTSSEHLAPELCLCLRNTGNILARFVTCLVYLPEWLDDHLFARAEITHLRKFEGKAYFLWQVCNISSTDALGYQPILPGLDFTARCRFNRNFSAKKIRESDEWLIWEVFADNASKREGEVPLGNVRWIHEHDNPTPELLHEPGVVLVEGLDTCKHQGTAQLQERAHSWIATCSVCGRQCTGGDAGQALAVLADDRVGDYDWGYEGSDLRTTGSVQWKQFRHKESLSSN